VRAVRSQISNLVYNSDLCAWRWLGRRRRALRWPAAAVRPCLRPRRSRLRQFRCRCRSRLRRYRWPGPSRPRRSCLHVCHSLIITHKGLSDYGCYLHLYGQNFFFFFKPIYLREPNHRLSLLGKTIVIGKPGFLFTVNRRDYN
jgi:hypothetical protein